LKEDFWTTAEAEYQKRLKRYARVEVVEVKDDAALLAAVPARGKLVALDERGELWSSPDLAAFLAKEAAHGAGDALVFGIGGAEGFGEEVRRRAVKTVAFGRITLPHRLARVLLLEQLYRSLSILRGEPYAH